MGVDHPSEDLTEKIRRMRKERIREKAIEEHGRPPERPYESGSASQQQPGSSASQRS